MKGPHDYNATCMCYRCKGIRNSPTFKAIQANPKAAASFSYRARIRKPKPKVASKEEQHARLLDCGPQNWDDRE